MNNKIRKMSYILSNGPGSITEIMGTSVLIYGPDNWAKKIVKENILLQTLLPNLTNDKKLVWFNDEPNENGYSPNPYIQSIIFPKHHVCNRCKRVYNYESRSITTNGDNLKSIIGRMNIIIQQFNIHSINKLKKIDYVFCAYCTNVESISNILNCEMEKLKISIDNFHKKSIRMKPFRFIGICEDGHIFDIDVFFLAHPENNRCNERHRFFIDTSYRYFNCEGCGIHNVSVRETINRARHHKAIFQWIPESIPHNELEECSANVQRPMRGDKKVWYPITRSALKLINKKSISDERFIEIKNFSKQAYVEHLNSQRNGENLKRYILQNYQNELEGYICLYEAEQYHLKEKARADMKINLMESDLRKVEVEVLSKNLQSAGENSFNNLSEDQINNSKLNKILKKITRIDKLELDFTIIGLSRLSSELYQNGDTLQIAPVTRQGNYPMVNINIEGFLLQFDANKFSAWSEKNSSHVNNLSNELHRNLIRKKNIEVSDNRSDLLEFYLLHSISHYLISKLAFTSGYNVMGLRERLYFYPGVRGIMIHTTDGDEEGSMGGIAFNSSIPRLEKLFEELEPSLRQCSNDPVCMHDKPRGNNTNFSACYACLILPETSCEFMNSYLDRNTLIGNGKNGKPFGFFHK